MCTMQKIILQQADIHCIIYMYNESNKRNAIRESTKKKKKSQIGK